MEPKRRALGYSPSHFYLLRPAITYCCCLPLGPRHFFQVLHYYVLNSALSPRITESKKNNKKTPFLWFKWPLNEPLLFHSLFHEGEENQNVIMFTMFASRTVTKSLSRVRSCCRKHRQIARCHPSLLFFPSLKLRYLISNLVNFSAVSQ